MNSSRSVFYDPTTELLRRCASEFEVRRVTLPPHRPSDIQSFDSNDVQRLPALQLFGAATHAKSSAVPGSRVDRVSTEYVEASWLRVWERRLGGISWGRWGARLGRTWGFLKRKVVASEIRGMLPSPLVVTTLFLVLVFQSCTKKTSISTNYSSLCLVFHHELHPTVG